ncbi:MAG: hypothetical protein CL764_05005 [Chloroflexi bacterium]|nr:hypothetical protein [Chloroflexota bacterium]
MCGILAVYSKLGVLNFEDCERATDKIFSRGPDYNFSNYYLDGKLYLSQTVLSITGNPSLNISYRQSNNGRFEILFNGEIYNHNNLQNNFLESIGNKNISGTDTETFVNLHEVMTPNKVFKTIEGMFAYILFDKESKELIIGRDMIGEKVIYKYEDNNIFIVSSQIGPILELVPEIKIDKDVLREYFFTRHLLTPQNTIYKNLDTFQPGVLTKLNLHNNNYSVIDEKFPYSLIDEELIIDRQNENINNLTKELRSVFLDNAIQLTQDSSLMSVFSGGVDSSIASKFSWSVNKESPNLIILQFPGKDNVASQIKKFGDLVNKNILDITVTPEQFREFADECYEAICMPFPTHHFISQAILARKVRENNFKVLLTGDGGDELFGGYEFYKQLPQILSSNYDNKTNPSIYSGVNDLGFKFHDWNKEKLLEKSNKLWMKTLKLFNHLNDDEKVIQSILYLDFTIQLESVGIRASDTMTMMSSVESRGFFLTEKVMKFALNLPSKFKIDISSKNIDDITRPLMKNLFKKEFSEALLFPKQGFSGYPNESLQEVVDKDFKISKEFLEITEIPSLLGEDGIASTWKLVNVEYFLKSFEKFL